MSDFWQENQVGGPYANVEESEAALKARAELYPDLAYFMPVTYPEQTVLDFGCGPGHDTILFLRNDAKHVYYVDVSELALVTTCDRLAMHGIFNRATGFHSDLDLPVVDHVHCAGVLHHTEDPLEILKRLRAALREGGEARVMVYDGTVSERSKSEVPITEWWTYEEFLDLSSQAGFDGRHVGSYPCSAEWRPNCFAACYALH